MKSSCTAFGAGSCPSRPRKRSIEKFTSSESTVRSIGAVNFASVRSERLSVSPSGVNSQASTRSPAISEFGAFSKVDAICLKRKLWTCAEEPLVVLLWVRCGSSVSGVPLIRRRKTPPILPGSGAAVGVAAAVGAAVGVAAAVGAAVGVAATVGAAVGAASSSSSSPQPTSAAAASPAPPSTPPRSAARRVRRVRQNPSNPCCLSVMRYPFR